MLAYGDFARAVPPAGRDCARDSHDGSGGAYPLHHRTGGAFVSGVLRPRTTQARAPLNCIRRDG